jgi:hypothetical protein
MTRTKTRALANWPNNAVSILDFGAKGDGVTDDTAAFQAAMAAEKNLIIPPGTFIVSSTLTLPSSSDSSNRSFQGQYPNSIIKFTGSGSLFRVPGGKVNFNGLTFTTDETSGYTKTCIADEQEMDDRPTFISNCQFTRFKIAIQGNSNLTCISDCQFLFNETCIKSSGPLMNSYITGCMMQFNDKGIELNRDGASVQPEGTRIFNNTIQASNPGIAVKAGLEILISGNIVDQTYANAVAILLEPDEVESNSLGSIKILNNWVNIGPDATSCGIRFVSNTRPISQVQIRGNTFAGGGAATAIDVQKCNTLQIADNIFKTNWTSYFPVTDGPVVIAAGVTGYERSSNITTYGNPLDLQGNDSMHYKADFRGSSTFSSYGWSQEPAWGMSMTADKGVHIQGDSSGGSALYFGAYDPNDAGSPAASASKGAVMIRSNVGLYVKTNDVGNVWSRLNP